MFRGALTPHLALALITFDYATPNVNASSTASILTTGDVPVTSSVVTSLSWLTLMQRLTTKKSGVAVSLRQQRYIIDLISCHLETVISHHATDLIKLTSHDIIRILSSPALAMGKEVSISSSRQHQRQTNRADSGLTAQLIVIHPRIGSIDSMVYSMGYCACFNGRRRN
jgi:hypothetical protein